jgi:hypothetical protein
MSELSILKRMYLAKSGGRIPKAIEACENSLVVARGHGKKQEHKNDERVKPGSRNKKLMTKTSNNPTMAPA